MIIEDYKMSFLNTTESQALSCLFDSTRAISILTRQSNNLAKLTDESCLTAEKLKNALIISDSELLSNAFSIILKGINSKVQCTSFSINSFINFQADSEKEYDVAIVVSSDCESLSQCVKNETIKNSKVFLLGPSSMQLMSLSEMGVDIAVSLESNANDIRDAFLRGLNGENFSIGFAESFEEKYPQLTQRQKDVLKLICAGKSNKEIARDLNIALSTIKTHCAAIFKELGVMNRTQAVLILGG